MGLALAEVFNRQGSVFFHVCVSVSVPVFGVPVTSCCHGRKARQVLPRHMSLSHPGLA